MAGNKYVKALVSVVLLIVLVFVLQLVVGVFGVANAQVNNSLQVATGSKTSTAVVQFGQVGTSNATIIPFITVIVIVALVVILLDLFGIGDILNLKQGE